MVWNAQDAEEKQDIESAVMGFFGRQHGFCNIFGCTVCFILMVPVVGFGTLIAIGPTLITDFLFFWKKRQTLRKQLVSTSVPVKLHIIHRRQMNGKFFVRLGYRMDNNVSYVAKNEEEVTEQIYKLTKNTSTRKIRIFLRAHTSFIWNNGILLGNVSSSYPASGPCYSESFSAGCCKCFMGLFMGLCFTAFNTFILGTIAGARTILGYFAVAGLLIFIGFLISAYLYSSWRNTTLHGYEVVDELPSTMIDGDDDNDDDKNNDGLEMGMLVVQEDDDTETLAITREYISSDDEDEELETVGTIQLKNCLSSNI
jgi:hypothetical protein